MGTKTAPDLDASLIACHLKEARSVAGNARIGKTFQRQAESAAFIGARK